MSDQVINGSPTRRGRGLAIVAHPVELEQDQTEFELVLRDPANVRMLSWAIREEGLVKKVRRELPVLFVECDPEGLARPHRFVLLATNYVMTPKEGFRMRYRDSAISINTGMIGHLFELELDPSSSKLALIDFTAPEKAS